MQHHVVRTGAERLGDLQAVADDVAVRQRHALSGAGRSAGIEQQRFGALLRLAHLRRFRRCEQIVEALRALPLRRRIEQHQRAGPALGLQMLSQRQEPRGDENHPRPALQNDRCYLRWRQTEVDRHRNRARPVSGMDQFALAHRIGGDDGETLARSQTHRPQRAGQPRDFVHMLGPGVAGAVFVDGRQAAGKMPARAQQRGGHGQHGQSRLGFLTYFFITDDSPRSA